MEQVVTGYRRSTKNSEYVRGYVNWFIGCADSLASENIKLNKVVAQRPGSISLAFIKDVGL